MPASSRRETPLLVTGASSGLGLETASLLAASGFKVYGGARSFQDGVAPHERGFKSLRLDVLSDASVASALAAIEADAGAPVSVLVNNAGRGMAGALEDCSVEEALELFNLNFFSVLRMVRAVLPAMRERGDGVIVNVGSLIAKIPLPYQGLYAASKAALEAMSESLATELRPLGVRVALISPGDFKSGFTKGRVRSGELKECYRERFGSFMAGVESRELEGMAASRAASEIVKIVEGRSASFAHPVGTLSERLCAIAKPFIPKRAMDKMIESHYGA